jgi:hypothetical protein
MTTDPTDRVRTVVKIDGDVGGQVAIGHGITQSILQVHRTDTVTEAELADLSALIDDLRSRVAADTPPELRTSALERIDELAEAVTAEKPELDTARYVMGWFHRKVPTLASAVRTLILNPLLSRVVGAAGDVAAADLQHFLHDISGT